MVEDFRNRFWISLVLTIPILLLSPLIQGFLGLEEAIQFPGDLIVLFALSSLLFSYGGWPFLKGIYLELSTRQPGMMTLGLRRASWAVFRPQSREKGPAHLSDSG